MTIISGLSLRFYLEWLGCAKMCACECVCVYVRERRKGGGSNRDTEEALI